MGRNGLEAVVRAGRCRHCPGAKELAQTGSGESRAASGAGRRSGLGQRVAASGADSVKGQSGAG
jgi:hypothetical protein